MKIDHQDAGWRRARRAVCASRAGLAEETLCSASPCSRAPAGRGWRLRLPTGRLACGRNPGLRAASLPGPRAAPSRRHRPGRGRASRPRAAAAPALRGPAPPPQDVHGFLSRPRHACCGEGRRPQRKHAKTGAPGAALAPRGLPTLRTHLRFPPQACPACPRQAAPRWASSPAVVGCSAQRKQPSLGLRRGHGATLRTGERLLGASGEWGGGPGPGCPPLLGCLASNRPSAEVTPCHPQT